MLGGGYETIFTSLSIISVTRSSSECRDSVYAGHNIYSLRDAYNNIRYALRLGAVSTTPALTMFGLACVPIVGLSMIPPSLSVLTDFFSYLKTTELLRNKFGPENSIIHVT